LIPEAEYHKAVYRIPSSLRGFYFFGVLWYFYRGDLENLLRNTSRGRQIKKQKGKGIWIGS